MVRTWEELGKNMVRIYQVVMVGVFLPYLGLFLPEFSENFALRGDQFLSPGGPFFSLAKG
ncbi:MAG: hypothetical protein IJM88_02375 [Bacteroidales bacterium]|nr:hypothetical protein [Bacteroidales bacterium]